MTVGILIIHGFTGTRKEMEPLKEYLEKLGFIVSVPLLSGHELTRKDLAGAKYIEWVKSAEEAAEELKKRCDRLIIIGFSMGGLIAAHLCQSMNVEKLVFINTPVYYWDIKRIFINLKGDFATYFKKYFLASTNKPLSALLEFQKLLSKTKPLFSNITCPTLIIQTLDDDTVNPRSADYIFGQLHCEKKILKFPSGGHLVFQEGSCGDVLDAINEFAKLQMYSLPG